MSSMMSPMEAVWLFRSSRALSLRRKPSSLIALRTRLAVSGVTPGSSLTTRETVSRRLRRGSPRPHGGTATAAPHYAHPGQAASPWTAGPGISASNAGRLARLARYAVRPVAGTAIKIADHAAFPCSSRRTAGTLGWPPACTGVMLPVYRNCPGGGSPHRQVCYKTGLRGEYDIVFLQEYGFRRDSHRCDVLAFSKSPLCAVSVIDCCFLRAAGIRLPGPERARARGACRAASPGMLVCALMTTSDATAARPGTGDDEERHRLTALEGLAALSLDGCPRWPTGPRPSSSSWWRRARPA